MNTVLSQTHQKTDIYEVYRSLFLLLDQQDQLGIVGGTMHPSHH